ncbi:hypothetical protein K443DRAFT_608940 [Laccaria amethystina LaAM-08-1]|uniref:Uncharacterized protein n=1 Tax=Laccaria amethystina LaAM-08-1 TaxID=1095629 RepID=A0A0C9YCK9_9AGAR|nr:hypothetical protein K443DRAFT_608940 [Laccaria amethystina LaAM-08-1]
MKNGVRRLQALRPTNSVYTWRHFGRNIPGIIFCHVPTLLTVLQIETPSDAIEKQVCRRRGFPISPAKTLNLRTCRSSSENPRILLRQTLGAS